MANRNLAGDDPRFTRRYLTPGKDFLVREKIRDDEAARLAIGTAHKVVSVYPDFLVCAFQAADEEGWQYVYYLKTRAAQNAYAYEFANVLSEEFPTIRQDFVLLRSTWTPAQSAPVTELPPAFGIYTWTFIEESEKRGEEIEDGLFVRVQRVWRHLTTGLVTRSVDPEMGDTRTSTRTLVPASTAAAAVDASGSTTEIQPINTKFAWQTTRALAGMPALAGGSGVYEDSLDKEMNWSWDPVLLEIRVNAVLAGDAFSEVVGYNVIPVYLSNGYQGKCQCTETRRWTKKKPIRAGDAGWYWGPAWAAGTFTVGAFRTYADETYISLTNHTGSTAPPSDTTNWKVSSPLLRSADKLLPQSINFQGVELGRISIPPCLHGGIILQDTQTIGRYEKTSPRLWPQTILGDVQLSRYPGGGYLTQEFYIDAPNADGIAGDIELSIVSVTSTTALVEWTGETTGSVTATYLDVSIDPDFGYGFLSGFNGAVVTPAALGTPKQATITGMVRGTPYYTRIRRGALTSNYERVQGLPQAEITLTSSGALADNGTLAFGNATVGTTSNTKTIRITNDGLRTLDGISVVLSGTNSGDWVLGTLPTSVALQDFEEFVVTCNPTAINARTAILTVTSNAPSNPSYVVNLTATGQSPEINVVYSASSYASGSAINFSGVTTGGSSTDYTLTVENTGTGNLTVSAGITSADSAWAVQTQPTSPVAGSGSTTMVVRFTPNADGGSSAVLTITNNDANESSYVLYLSAEATATGTLQVTNPWTGTQASGSSFEFGRLVLAADQRDYTFVLTNSGVGVLNGISTALTGTNAADFTITLGATSLAAAETTTMVVRWYPLASGARTATLTITSSDAVTPSFTLSLTATGLTVAAPQCQIEQPLGTVITALDFGNQLVTSGTVTKASKIRNIGGTSQTTIAAGFSGTNSGDWTASGLVATLASTVPTIVTDDFDLIFNPSGYGPRTATLGITSNATTYNVSLTGVGVPATPLLTAQSAGVIIGQASATAMAATASNSVTPAAYAVAVSATGKLAMSCSTDNRILIWNTVPTTSGTAADLVLGQANFTATASATTAAGLNTPQGLCWHGANLWVADTGNHRVLRYTNPTASGQAASLVLGQTDFTSGSTRSAAANATKGMSQPNSVYIYGSKLFVADTGHHRVIVWNSVPTATDTAGSLVLGQTNTTNSSSGLTGATMNNPRAMAVSKLGHLHVVDSTNNRVLRFAGIPTATGTSATFALFQANLTSNATGTTASTCNLPYAIAVSALGYIAVADVTNDRVLIFYEELTAIGSAHAALGQVDLTTGTAWASNSATNMNNPTGLAWSGTSLIVSASSMSRAMRFSPA